MTPRTCLTIVALAILALSLVAQPARDVSGIWKFKVELQGGATGEPTFALKQTGKQVAGTYTGPLGEFKVSGTVEADRVTLTFDFEQEGTAIKATYQGKLVSETAMTGSVIFAPGGAGKWTAQKSK
jgi:hypothetical protein